MQRPDVLFRVFLDLWAYRYVLIVLYVLASSGRSTEQKNLSSSGPSRSACTDAVYQSNMFCTCISPMPMPFSRNFLISLLVDGRTTSEDPSSPLLIEYRLPSPA